MPKMTDTSETVNVKRGDTVHWRLNYQNKGTLFADDVTVRDPLPEGLEIVPNSIKLTTALGTVTLPDTALGSGGANVGDYIPTGNGVIRYSTKVNTKPEVCELVNKAFVKAANTPKEDSDTAKIVITDCNPTQPVYTCDSFTLTLLRDRTYKFETKATAKNGAVIKFYEYNFGDNTTVLQTDAASVEHTYAADGNYVANVKVTFEVDGKLVTVGGTENCSKSLSMLTSYTCDSFTLTLVRDRTYKFETKASAKGSATIKGYEYNFGDNTEVVKTDKNTVEHTYAKDGTYTSVVTVVFMVDGQEKKVTNDNCKKTVSFEHNKPMCDLPGKGHLPKDSPECKVLGVTTLPKTGAALHRRMTLRRNS